MEHQKTATVFLMGSHLSLRKIGIPLTEEMLDWEIRDEHTKYRARPDRCNVYYAALKAMLKLHPFQIRFSMGVDIENKTLIAPVRDWALIRIYGRHVLHFGCFKAGGPAMHRLYEWHLPDFFHPESMDWEIRQWRGRCQSLVFTMTSEQWFEFFRTTILNRYTALTMNAEQLESQAKAERAKKRAQLILENISLVS